MKSLDAAAERVSADALDRFWDGLTAAHPGGPSRPDELLDPSLQHSVRRLRLVDETPGPDPLFAARLRSELMASQAVPVAMSPAPGRRFGSLVRRRVLVELVVAAALLLAVLGGGPALNLPVSLDPAAPTVAASAAAPGSAGFAAAAACAQTVTPEPTAAVAVGAEPVPTRPAAPVTPATAVEMC